MAMLSLARYATDAAASLPSMVIRRLLAMPDATFPRGSLRLFDPEEDCKAIGMPFENVGNRENSRENRRIPEEVG
jgi:hypothetical protein